MEKKTANSNSRLPRKCPACGYPNRTLSKFCRRCGTDLSRPSSPKDVMSDGGIRIAKWLDTRALAYALSILFFIASFSSLAFVASGSRSDITLSSAFMFPVLLTLLIVHLAWLPDTARAFDALGHIFIQRSVHSGWLFISLAIIGAATARIWLPVLFNIQEESVTGIIFAPVLCLLLAGAYGFVVRKQVEDRSFYGFVSAPQAYRASVTRVVFLLLSGFLLCLAGIIASQAGRSAATSLSQTYLWLGFILWIFAIIAMHFHLPIAFAILARDCAARALKMESIFFLGEPIRRGHLIISNVYRDSKDTQDNLVGRDRGILKGILGEELSGLKGLEIATAKIPVPASLNLRYGEKGVHKYIQVTMPTHAGRIKMFIAFQGIGKHLSIGYAMYFLGEESHKSLLANALQILKIYVANYLGVGSTVENRTAESRSDDSALSIPPRLKPASEMDMLTRANRDELVDHAAGVLWLGVSQSFAQFESKIKQSEESQRADRQGVNN